MLIAQAGELDDPHLEFALHIIKDSGVGVDVAVQHLAHPTTYVRWAAIHCLLEHGVQDASWLGAIRKARASGLFGSEELDVLLCDR